MCAAGTAEDAARAYDREALCYIGSSAVTNFPSTDYMLEAPSDTQQLYSQDDELGGPSPEACHTTGPVVHRLATDTPMFHFLPMTFTVSVGALWAT